MFDFLKKIFSLEGRAEPRAPARGVPAPSAPFDDEEDEADIASLGPPPASLRAEGPLPAEERDETLTLLRHLVWAGFDGRRTILEATLEAMDDAGDSPAGARNWIEAQLDAMIEAKRGEEALWPAVVEWDRLDAAFESLADQGVVALHAPAYTQDEAREAALARWAERGGAEAGSPGVAFYSLQDVEDALDRGALTISFSAAGDPRARGAEASPAEAALEKSLRRALTAGDFALGETRRADGHGQITLAPMEWRKRSPR
jgi:phosphoglycolate phosphatase-like HAD superfamily hydrolase